MNDLKPCPFCGGEAELRDDNGNEYPYTVECVECGAMTSQHRHADTQFGAIEAWNARAERTCRNDDGWCSECDHFLHDGFKWCPWCGAKIEKGDGE